MERGGQESDLRGIKAGQPQRFQFSLREMRNPGDRSPSAAKRNEKFCWHCDIDV